MTKQKYFIYLGISLIASLGLLGGIYAAAWVELPEKMYILLNLMLPLLFLLGGGIITFGKLKNPDSLSQRFLILTLVQMLAFLSIILAVKVAQPEQYKVFALLFVALFLVMMAIQTVLVISYGKTAQEERIQEEKKEE